MTSRGATLRTMMTRWTFENAGIAVVIIVRSVAPREVIGALQWRPELLASGKPWFDLAIGGSARILMRDGYPTPTVPWEYEVFLHAYQFPTQ